MELNFYREQALETIARNLIKTFDASLLYGAAEIPIEDIIEKQYGLTVVYQHIRKYGNVLGETAFDDTFVAVYDKEEGRYLWLPVERGTVIIDARLLNPKYYGRLRFTLAHELAHWLIHQYLYTGSLQTAAMLKSIRKSSEADKPVERQADTLGSLILMPAGQVKMGFYRHRSDADPAYELSKVFGVSKPAMEIRMKELRLM